MNIICKTDIHFFAAVSSIWCIMLWLLDGKQINTNNTLVHLPPVFHKSLGSPKCCHIQLCYACRTRNSSSAYHHSFHLFNQKVRWVQEATGIPPTKYHLHSQYKIQWYIYTYTYIYACIKIKRTRTEEIIQKPSKSDIVGNWQYIKRNGFPHKDSIHQKGIPI